MELRPLRKRRYAPVLPIIVYITILSTPVPMCRPIPLFIAQSSSSGHLVFTAVIVQARLGILIGVWATQSGRLHRVPAAAWANGFIVRTIS